MEIYTFPQGISLNVTELAWLEFEFTYFKIMLAITLQEFLCLMIY